jgi:hypothetical protein
MSAEKRRNTRRTISYPALIDAGDGSPPRECSLCDASQEGAQLLVPDPAAVPDEFVLALSAGGGATRKCRVIWRREQLIGVEFMKETRKSVRPPALPRFTYPPTTPSSDASTCESGVVEPFDLVTLPPR